MITFIINDKPVQFPTSWEDVTYSQYLEILKPDNNYIKLVSVFTGIDYDTLQNAVIPNLELIIEATNFLQQKPDYDFYYPQVGPYKLPPTRKDNDKNSATYGKTVFDIRFESMGQFEDMRHVMSKIEGTTGLVQAYGKAVAIYLQKIRDGEYKPSKVPELEEEIKNFRACEVIAAGQFFFLKLARLSNGTQKTSPIIVPTSKKSKPASTPSKRSSARTR